MSSDSALKAMPRMPTLRPRNFIRIHGDLPEREAMFAKCEQLHRVLHQARARCKPWSRDVGHARITAPHLLEQFDVIDVRLRAHHVELVSRSEHDVAKGIAD